MLNQDISVSEAWVLRKSKETLLMQKIMILTIAFIQQNLVKDESRFSIVNNDLKVRIPYLYFSDWYKKNKDKETFQKLISNEIELEAEGVVHFMKEYVCDDAACEYIVTFPNAVLPHICGKQIFFLSMVTSPQNN